MFHDEDDGDEDRAAYEDELYRDESSSEDSIDSEVEFYLYSQVHYSQNLTESNKEEIDADPQQCISEKKPQLNSSVITVTDNDEISDSSGVIILSDTMEEDSVYSLKTKRKSSKASLHWKGVLHKPGNQSTPKDNKSCSSHSKLSSGCKTGQLNVSRSYKGGLIQEVLVIRGSSEDERIDEYVVDTETESESDQSDLENWMLLGRAKEEGDTSIQLNIEGCRSPSTTGEGGIDWSIGERDTEAQIGNYASTRRSSNRYYTDKDVVCRNCNKRGHLSKNCPSPRKMPACCLCGERGHFQNTCPARYCSNCFLPGHLYRDCIERAYWKKDCHRCSMTGHYADACPEIWRQYHLTVKPGPIRKLKSGQAKKNVYCCNCARKGHCIYECTEKLMYNGSFPSCQLVFTYDGDRDIWKRNERAKLKIKELQDADLLPYAVSGPDKDLDMSPSKKKKKHLKEFKHLHGKEKPHTSKKNAYLEKITEKKLKKRCSFLKSQALGEDFPRGGSAKSSKPKKKKHFDNNLFGESAGERFKKQKRNRRKHKGERYTAVDESLLIIKQRKKKSKKNNN
ncbi:zinc finger CCHC domain-containing 7 [Pelobates cultripes]|uniref:Zinc finger CCHC domain-containing protein 7 n=1 Tax=Pelobates cultripes TaxID=61616 RepID=A0AAD1S659_PELCU|nr:zinc finger CCHC domain-containing 7 [Pelobates cultripes]